MASPVNSAAPRSVSFVPAVALIAGAIVLASSPILVRLSELPPTATAFYRVALAVPVIHLLSRYMSSGAGEAQTPLGISSIAAIAAAGALFAADLSFLHWSLRFTSVANSTLFLNLAPCFAGIAGWLLFRQRLSVRFARSLALALFGVVLLIGILQSRAAATSCWETYSRSRLAPATAATSLRSAVFGSGSRPGQS